MVNYSYPLPAKDLHIRYEGLFEALKRGQSSTLIGLPVFGKAAWLKFILYFDKSFLREFIDTDDFLFLEIDEKKLSPEQLLRLILTKLKSTKSFEGLDTLLLQSLVENQIKSLPQKLVIFMPRAEELITEDSQIANTIGNISKIGRIPPNTKVMFILGGNPTLLQDRGNSKYLPIWHLLNEYSHFCPLMTDSETEYFRTRIESLSNKKVDNQVHKIAKSLSGGHTVLYQKLISLDKKTLEAKPNLKNNDQISPLLESIWQGIPNLAKKNWNSEFISSYFPLQSLGLVRNNKITLSLLPPMQLIEKTQSDESLPELTAQQKLIFDYLQENSNRVISRDELAQAIWGKLWQEKYSDWAIDRSMSKLRKQFQSSNYQIRALRGRGYILNTV